MRETRVQSLGREDLLEKEMATHLLGESHGQRSLVGYSPQSREESYTTERLHFTSTHYRSCHTFFFVKFREISIISFIQKLENLENLSTDTFWLHIFQTFFLLRYPHTVSTKPCKKCSYRDCPGGPVDKVSPPANAGDTGSIPGPGRFHMPQSN